MTKKIIITSQLIIFLFINTFSQSDTTVCIDFQADLNHKIRKNVIGINYALIDGLSTNLEISYERILKENKTITANFGGTYFHYSSFHCNLGYRLYFSNMKYAKIKNNDETYFIRKQQKTMLAPKGLYVGTMANLKITKYYRYDGHISTGIGVNLGYQFLFFNRIVLNASLQLPLTVSGYFYYHTNSSGQKKLYGKFYNLRPKMFFNLNIGYAF